MDRLSELKEYALLHARNQGMTARHAARILARIHNDDPGDQASWARVWSAEADALAARGRLLDACRCYALARFPYPGDDPRIRAQHAGVTAFDTWRRARRRGIERLELAHPQGRLACWTTGLRPGGRRPLLVMTGGIVSVKEQWAPLLPKLSRLGYAAVVTEMPGVGENTLPYTADSWRLLPWLLDELSDRARTTDATLLCLSFSGHMALRTAVEDRRVGRVLTVGAPVAHFFTDDDWWDRVPGITVTTLCRLTGAADPAELRSLLKEFPLEAEQLGGVRAAVRYVASARDEIIPPREQALLQAALPDIRVKTFDDVHGSPDHAGALRRWLVLNLLRSARGRAAG
ncbi:alpha/beta hydrolase [Streptomyces sp. NPDC050803]|uniref:alpha/beta fold hydrolase n=1 Tax=unclassified Streptomyces TaxID=2593676 RepID=UPI003445C39B